MKRKILTSRQERILDYIRNFLARRGYPPSIREIGDGCGLRSPRSVARHLEILEEGGFIRRERDKSRALELIDRGRSVPRRDRASGEALIVPLVGRVRAGEPDLAAEEMEGTILIDPAVFGSGELFLLRIEGDSMIDAHILPGDLVVVERDVEGRDGDIVVALIGDEATVKFLEKKGERVRLVPANPSMEPMELGTGEVEARVLGRVVGVIRSIGGGRV